MKFLFTFFLFASMMFAQLTVSPRTMSATTGRVLTNPIKLVGTATLQNSTVNPFYFVTDVEEPYDNFTLVQYSGYPTLGLNQTIWVYIDTATFPDGNHEFDVRFRSILDPHNVLVLTVNISLNDVDPNLQFVPTNSLIGPHIAIGDVWNTRLVLSNPHNETSRFRMNFFDSEGNPMNVGLNSLYIDNPRTSSYSTFMFPGTSMIVDVLPVKEGLQVGSVLFELIEGDVPMVNVEFDNGVDVASVQADKPISDNIVLQYNNEFPYATGVAIANSLNKEQIVSLDFFDSYGMNYLSEKIVIPAKGKTSFMLTDYPETFNRVGVLKITSAYTVLSAFGLIFDVENNTFYVTAKQ